jgi:hypothetical protein
MGACLALGVGRLAVAQTEFPVSSHECIQRKERADKGGDVCSDCSPIRLRCRSDRPTCRGGLRKLRDTGPPGAGDGQGRRVLADRSE